MSRSSLLVGVAGRLSMMPSRKTSSSSREVRWPMSSPGCFPITTSIITPPKLYTSHFSVATGL
uniref:Uncharacterized protein n=1 Tax=Arundo donax TaxID=35708 RepID=A0A0A9BCA9_ARUDO